MFYYTKYRWRIAKAGFHSLNNLSLNYFDLSVVIIYRDKGDYLKELRKEVKKIFLVN